MSAHPSAVIARGEIEVAVKAPKGHYAVATGRGCLCGAAWQGSAFQEGVLRIPTWPVTRADRSRCESIFVEMLVSA